MDLKYNNYLTYTEMGETDEYRYGFVFWVDVG